MSWCVSQISCSRRLRCRYAYPLSVRYHLTLLSAFSQPPADDPSGMTRWARFAHYGSLVAELSLDAVLDISAHQDILKASVLLPRNTWMTPNLRALTCSISSVEDMIAASQFICPRLLKLNYSVEAEYVYSAMEDVLHVSFFFRSLASTAKILTTCTIFQHVVIRGQDSPFIQLFRLPLTNVSVTFMTPEIFVALAACETLSELELNWDEFEALNIPAAAFKAALDAQPAPQFPSLKKVGFGMNTPVMASIVPILGRVPLQEVHFDIWDEGVFEEPRSELFTGSACWAGTLRKAHITLGRDGVFLWTTLEGLLACRLIEDFLFEVEHIRHAVLQIRDSDVLAMAVAWPRLQRLGIDWQPNYGDPDFLRGLVEPGQLTLSSLGHLAAHCPELSFVSLTFFDASGSIPELAEPPRRFQMQDLCTNHAVVPYLSVEAVARFLGSLWPAVRISLLLEKWINQPIAIECPAEWEKINQLLRTPEL